MSVKQRIIRNAARCRKCGDVIESKHHHDFRFCKCGAIFVDGGHSYIRWGGNPKDFEDLCEYAPVVTNDQKP
jgi:tRNA(Ile2) C34 agmatinyltransferase TiaS